MSACSSRTRAVRWWWNHPSGMKNTIDYVQIMTTGNAIDFGDLNLQIWIIICKWLSNGHGGLG